MSLFSASPPTVIPSGFRWSCRIFVKEACPNIEFILGFQEVIQFYAQTSLNLEEFKSMSSNIFTSADSNLRAGSSSVHLVHWGWQSSSSWLDLSDLCDDSSSTSFPQNFGANKYFLRSRTPIEPMGQQIGFTSSERWCAFRQAQAPLLTVVSWLLRRN